MRQGRQALVVVVFVWVAGCASWPSPAPSERSRPGYAQPAATVQMAHGVPPAPALPPAREPAPPTAHQAEPEAPSAMVMQAEREAQIEARVQELAAQLRAAAPLLETARRLQAAAEHAAVCRAADDAWQRWLRAAHTARAGLGTPQFLHLVDVAADYEIEARRLSHQVVEFSNLLGGRLCPQTEPAPAPPSPKAQRLQG